MTVTLMGAGGKMGCRITRQLRDHPDYSMRYVEQAETGRERLRALGVEPMPEGEALEATEVVIMAVPDSLMGSICEAIVPDLPAGAMVLLLDPAAAYAEVLPERSDIAYAITHPCHPPLFNDETDPEAREDFFGGQGLASQNVVCALHQGEAADYSRCEKLARAMYDPVMDIHRVTTEQMAILEPALVETLSATFIYAIYQGFERAVAMGVPEAAAWDFLMGHLRIEVAIIFGLTDFPFSDAAEQAVEEAMAELFVEDWEDRVFDRENIKASTESIARPDVS